MLLLEPCTWREDDRPQSKLHRTWSTKSEEICICASAHPMCSRPEIVWGCAQTQLLAHTTAQDWDAQAAEAHRRAAAQKAADNDFSNGLVAKDRQAEIAHAEELVRQRQDAHDTAHMLDGQVCSSTAARARRKQGLWSGLTGDFRTCTSQVVPDHALACDLSGRRLRRLHHAGGMLPGPVPHCSRSTGILSLASSFSVWSCQLSHKLHPVHSRLHARMPCSMLCMLQVARRQARAEADKAAAAADAGARKAAWALEEAQAKQKAHEDKLRASQAAVEAMRLNRCAHPASDSRAVCRAVWSGGTRRGCGSCRGRAPWQLSPALLCSSTSLAVPCRWKSRWRDLARCST